MPKIEFTNEELHAIKMLITGNKAFFLSTMSDRVFSSILCKIRYYEEEIYYHETGEYELPEDEREFSRKSDYRYDD